MWPFILTRSVTLSKSIPTTKARLLNILHDPHQALRTSPLITSLDQDPDSPEWYTLTEKVPLLGGTFVQTNQLKVHYVRTEDGYNAEVLTTAWTHLNSEARAREVGGEDQVVFEEKLTVQGLFFLMPFIVSTMTQTHEQVLNIVAEKAQEKMRSKVKTRLGNSTSDPYGLFHLTLNRLPSQDPSLPPKTEWLNMGYWKCSKTKERWKSISLDIHHLRSVDRVRKYQGSHELTDPKVDMYQADAVFDDKGTNHPLRMSLPFDSILALDCAYHFSTRQRFLQQSFQNLAPGGYIALADICFSATALQSRRTKILTSVLRLMPAENLISTEGYVSQMNDVGYEDVILQDITDNVFPGFSAFLKSRQWGWKLFGLVIDWYASAGAKFIIISGRKPL
ncbi:hypothetical protein CPB84DRAFT_1742213 [Gymnopilus junonius]|uniref:DUF7053 domain-containing protein n=1 Tax=Gymnopilus junonius TaxID=109634 RepID=A0A9P5TUB2_GYMJU|nr:hypothetical protein CPB84DRAFT_1742213 [Gymnopilus junonius]